jgi:hypothetical protein
MDGGESGCRTMTQEVTVSVAALATVLVGIVAGCDLLGGVVACACSQRKRMWMSKPPITNLVVPLLAHHGAVCRPEHRAFRHPRTSLTLAAREVPLCSPPVRQLQQSGAGGSTPRWYRGPRCGPSTSGGPGSIPIAVSTCLGPGSAASELAQLDTSSWTWKTHPGEN